ncbi:hypothetical protein EYW49_16625 [Siculibacillus lacustris]|uniref:Uncharacterized protein n=1 Tax=Siculibacillus lacustris TaxID=1549641 RepID=A0A4Q9VKL0_9HYPH|nr:hypothetical protein [Siculibacillus lacustris]TBW35074.1 hypothetical protein EYW49_16625 [Siculibacillus lacustris]
MNKTEALDEALFELECLIACLFEEDDFASFEEVDAVCDGLIEALPHERLFDVCPMACVVTVLQRIIPGERGQTLAATVMRGDWSRGESERWCTAVAALRVALLGQAA